MPIGIKIVGHLPHMSVDGDFAMDRVGNQVVAEILFTEP
jgi:hypothetical protein